MGLGLGRRGWRDTRFDHGVARLVDQHSFTLGFGWQTPGLVSHWGLVGKHLCHSFKLGFGWQTLGLQFHTGVWLANTCATVLNWGLVGKH